VPFRRVEERTNEIELLILVTPQLIDAMDACEVPPYGPGEMNDSPTDKELYCKGHIEVPRCCPDTGVEAYRFEVPGSRAPHRAEEVMPEDASGSDMPPDQLDEAPKPDLPAFHSDDQASRRSAPGHSARRADRLVSTSTPRRGQPKPAPTTASNPDNRSNPVRMRALPESKDAGNQPGFIGPVGYDVSNNSK
jgi:pilus assembly protein CpaC